MVCYMIADEKKDTLAVVVRLPRKLLASIDERADDIGVTRQMLVQAILMVADERYRKVDA